MSTISKKPASLIELRDCPTGCSIFHERKMGKHGPFYVCHRCKHTLSEHPKGGTDEPCGKCSICGGLLFWRNLPNGTRFQACWSPENHAAIFKPSKS